jgi:hypothetical protein
VGRNAYYYEDETDQDHDEDSGGHEKKEIRVQTGSCDSVVLSKKVWKS